MSTTTTTWQARLRRHYQKLKEQLKDKRFETRSLFQQQRLLARLHRCRVQLRHLAAGAVMTGSLLLGTAALGQYVPPDFLQDGNSFSNYSLLSHTDRGAFVDMDGDGDMDYVTVLTSGINRIYYYEHIGNVDSAQYVLHLNTANPLNGITGVEDMTFVDIDGDGDYDCFVSGYDYYNPTANEKILYYLNQGTSTNPNFVRQSTVNNPLAFLMANLRARSIARMQFVDMDKDHDLDLFISQQYNNASLFNNSLERTIYYENTGSNYIMAVTTPLDSVPNYRTNPIPLFIDDGCLDRDLDVVAADNGPAIFYMNRDSVNCYQGTTYFNTSLGVLERIKSSPNPISRNLHFDRPLSGNLLIYNSLGQLIEQQQLDDTTEVTLKHLPNGWYFLYCRTEDAILQEKIQIQH